MNYIRISFMLAFVAMTLGCAVNKQKASIVGDADLTQAKVFYVEHFEPDKRNFHNNISDQIKRLGYESTAGEPGLAPEKVDAVVTYKDKWMWDITNYMIELTITFRDPKGGFPLIVGESFHTSLTRLSPDEMIEEVVTNIFDEINKGAEE